MAARTGYHAWITSAPLGAATAGDPANGDPAGDPAASDPPAPPYQDHYPVTLCNGARLHLPIQPLPDGDAAIALLMSNQTPFSVEQTLSELLKDLAADFAPEVIVGIPTLGLDYARTVARDLGFPDYVALGNSRKFWYDDKLSVPVRSSTSPAARKKLYIDPMLVERVAGKRTLIVDDVINTGGSVGAAIHLLERSGASVIGLCVILIEGDAWRKTLHDIAPDWPGRVRGLGCIPLFKRSPMGWIAS